MMELGTDSGLCNAFLPLCDRRFTTGSSFADKSEEEAEEESTFSASLLLSFFFLSFFELDLGVDTGSFRGETPLPSSSSSPSMDPLVREGLGDDRLRLEFSSLK